MAKALRINDQIRISPVRVIDQDNNQVGIISREEALTRARDAGLDLVEVSPTERPPVCRIMDYGKFKYEKKKRQKVAQHGHVVMLKEIRLRPKTDVHDLDIKLRKAVGFLDEGHKVQFTMLFKGRERAHRDVAATIFDGIVQKLGESAKVERAPLMEGRRMTMTVAPAKSAPKGQTKPAGKPAAKPSPKPAVPEGKLEGPPQAAPDRPEADQPAPEPSQAQAGA